MLFRNLAVLSGVAALLASAQTAIASDVIPLKGTASYNKAQTTTLGSVVDADMELVRGGGGRGGFGGGFRGGFGGGFRGGFGGYRGGFYGGYRGGFYGGYRGYYGGYRGFGYGYGGFGYGGYYPYYGGYYPYYGSYYPYYGGYGYYCGNNLNYASPGYSSTVLSQPYSYAQPYSSNGPAPVINNFAYNGNGYDGTGYNGNGYGNGYNGNGGLPVAPPSGDGTYPYNGGPNMPVPMPVQQQQLSPAKTAPAPQFTLRLVSTTSQQPQPSTTYAYPAYGEDTRANGYTINRTIPAKQTKR